jgi:hypothetical protein
LRLERGVRELPDRVELGETAADVETAADL